MSFTTRRTRRKPERKDRSAKKARHNPSPLTEKDAAPIVFPSIKPAASQFTQSKPTAAAAAIPIFKPTTTIKPTTKTTATTTKTTTIDRNIFAPISFPPKITFDTPKTRPANPVQPAPVLNLPPLPNYSYPWGDSPQKGPGPSFAQNVSTMASSASTSTSTSTKATSKSMDVDVEVSSTSDGRRGSSNNEDRRGVGIGNGIGSVKKSKGRSVGDVFPAVTNWEGFPRLFTNDEMRDHVYTPRSRGPYSKTKHLTEDQKKERRQTQNRQSAQRTRYRQDLYEKILESQYERAVGVVRLLVKQLEVAKKHALGKRLTRKDKTFEPMPDVPLIEWDEYAKTLPSITPKKSSKKSTKSGKKTGKKKKASGKGQATKKKIGAGRRKKKGRYISDSDDSDDDEEEEESNGLPSISLESDGDVVMKVEPRKTVTPPRGSKKKGTKATVTPSTTGKRKKKSVSSGKKSPVKKSKVDYDLTGEEDEEKESAGAKTIATSTVTVPPLPQQQSNPSPANLDSIAAMAVQMQMLQAIQLQTMAANYFNLGMQANNNNSNNNNHMNGMSPPGDYLNFGGLPPPPPMAMPPMGGLGDSTFGAHGSFSSFPDSSAVGGTAVGNIFPSTFEDHPFATDTFQDLEPVGDMFADDDDDFPMSGFDHHHFNDDFNFGGPSAMHDDVF